MNRKKRKISGGRATTSNRKHSTVPCNDAVEVGDVATMDHKESTAGQDDDGERPDFRYVAWLLREKLNALIDGDQNEPPELELRSLLDMAASRKIISVDPKMLNPVLWRTLPKELLLLVFARLPVPDILRLRCLSKEWNRDMATANSEINRACDEASPTMVAGFSWGEGDSDLEFVVTICDLSTQRSQYSYRLHPANSINDRWDLMDARDGRLVCFVSTRRPSKANPLCILVVNLLTGIWRKLPPLLYNYLTLPSMMYIEVNPETKCYRVVVVGNFTGGRSAVEIYDSGAREWTIAAPPVGFLFGDSFTWQYDIDDKTFSPISMTRAVYDFAKGQLKRYVETGPHRGASVIKYEHHQDCVFVLHKNTSNGETLQAGGYCITKYRLQTNAEDWVQERSYLCSPFEGFREKDFRWMTLEVCDGFFMVLRYRFGHFWLLDLSSGEWSSYPGCFERHDYETSMGRAFWNAVP